MATVFDYINSTHYTFCVFTLLFFSSSVLSVVRFTRLRLPSPGPESFAFDQNGEGPYTGISDGRIVKYIGGKVGFVDYGFTAPNRSKVLCDGTNDTTLGMSCGRPLGLAYYYRTGEIYVADGYYELCVVGLNGGLATQLATGADGVPFKFPDGIEVDQRTRVVYMTDASVVYGLDQIDLVVSQRDATGRLIKYDPTTKKVTVLIRGLSGGSGVAISKDGSFLIVTEFVRQRLQKYWLRGPKANTADILVNLIGHPDKIIRTKSGDFWVAVTVEAQNTTKLLGQRINGDGIILETINFSPWFNASLITEVHENRENLYLGSLYVDYVGVYMTPKSFR